MRSTPKAGQAMPPYLLLSSLLGAVYGTLFHLWRGRRPHDLLIYFGAGILGFLLGQMLSNFIETNFFPIGPINLVEATVVSWIILFFVHWLRI